MNRTRKGLKRSILLSLLTIATATGVGAYGTFAYFTDTEESTSNLFSAGTLDLVLEDESDVDAFITAGNFAPGDSAAGDLVLKNEGSISSNDGDGHTVSLSMDSTVTQTDADAGTTDMAQYLEITTLTYDGSPLSVTDANGNGYADLDDLAAASFSGLSDPGAAGKVLDLAVSFHTDAGNDLQGDTVNLALTFTLEQS